MKILALEIDVPSVPDSAFTEEVLKEEAARAWELHQAGIVLIPLQVYTGFARFFGPA